MSGKTEGDGRGDRLIQQGRTAIDGQGVSYISRISFARQTTSNGELPNHNGNGKTDSTSSLEFAGGA